MDPEVLAVRKLRTTVPNLTREGLGAFVHMQVRLEASFASEGLLAVFVGTKEKFGRLFVHFVFILFSYVSDVSDVSLAKLKFFYLIYLIRV